MGATNHTTNYNLPQFVGSDKPTWLGDVNGAMSAIDTQMKANDTLGNTAKTTADTALANAATAQTAANNAQTKADTADTTANSALTKALANEAALTAFEQLFNLSTKIEYAGGDMTVTGGSVIASSNLILETNSDKSLFKLSGNIFFTTSSATGDKKITLTNTGLNPDSDYTIHNTGVEDYNSSSSPVVANDIHVKTNGDIDIDVYVTGAVTNMRVMMLPILHFNKSFGTQA